MRGGAVVAWSVVWMGAIDSGSATVSNAGGAVGREGLLGGGVVIFSRIFVVPLAVD